eukprot:COSAG03_NODE_159_length_11381_cov_85.480057_13_plen_95_part_00
MRTRHRDTVSAKLEQVVCGRQSRLCRRNARGGRRSHQLDHALDVVGVTEPPVAIVCVTQSLSSGAVAAASKCAGEYSLGGSLCRSRSAAAPGSS